MKMARLLDGVVPEENIAVMKNASTVTVPRKIERGIMTRLNRLQPTVIDDLAFTLRNKTIYIFN